MADEWTTRTPDQPRFVAGSIGPTNRTLSISPDVNNAAFRASTFDEMREAYRDQARGLIEGGSDLLLLETIFDTLNAKAALVGIEEAFDAMGRRVPLMISVTITDRSGRTLSGQTLDAFYVSIEHARPFSVGLNCALGAREIRPYLAELSRIATCYVSCHPNAGLPNAFGQYDELPDETGQLLREFADSGFVNIIGGCCGTTPDHIRRVAAAVAGVAPRVVPAPETTPFHALPRYSGLETLVIRPDSNFQMIGERTNVTGSKKFARLVQANNWAGAAEVALDQVRGGANILDVNMDEGMLDSERVHDRVPALHRDRAGDCAAAGDGRQLEVVGHRSRAQVRPGQVHRQLDQPEGRRGGFSREGEQGAALRRGDDRDGLRRARSG